MQHDATSILDFWFGTLDEHGRADPAHATRWFRPDPAFDETIRARFTELHAAVARGECDTWLGSPLGRLAFIVVLDQFSRNLFRDTARMFALDGRALDVAREGVEAALDRGLAWDHRSFFYMPLMHSEDVAMQERSVVLFAALRDSVAPEHRERASQTAQFAERHRDIVGRFGRFPHRNALLGRASTPDEVAFLQQPGSSFFAAAATPSRFPDWEARYKSDPTEAMPWYLPTLDPDVAQALTSHAITAGRVLDIGTGPATQAVALAERGLEVTGTDVSPTAIEKATALAASRGVRARFVYDDVLATQLTGPFDLVLDRGCFHVLDPDKRAVYVHTVAKLLAPKGVLLLKCFSDEQPGTQGPHRFTPDQVRAVFEPTFRVVSIDRTVYQGTLDPQPRALFCVLTLAASGRTS